MKPLEWTTEKRRVNDLIELEINPRRITEKKKAELVASLDKFNLVEIPAINTDNKLIAGNQRLKVLQLAGRGEELIDVRVPNRKLTIGELKEYAIISNSHSGEWDFDLLQVEFSDIDMDFVGLDMKKIEFEASPVFDKQMDTFFERKEAKLLKAEEDGFEPQDGGTVTDIVIGDLFEIGHHRLLCGDSTDSDAVAKLMNGEKADMYLTDAPYGVSYADKNKFLNSIDNGNRIQEEIQNDHETVTDMYQFWRNVATTAILFINDVSTYYWFACQGGDKMMMMMALKDSGFAVKHELIWVKNNHVLGRTDYAYKHEPIIYGWKIGGTHKYYGEFCTSVFEYPKPLKNDLHPTMKPIELLEKLITNSSLESNIVLDSFLGSGSTMVASHQLNRKCYGMELEPKYCQVIVDRMRKLDPTIEIKRNGTLYTKQDGI